MPSRHQIPTAILPSSHQIAGGFLGRTGNRDLHDLTQMQQPGQMRGIAGIFSELK